MSDDPEFKDDEKLAVLPGCAWCGGALGQSVLPTRTAIVFCSRPCEIEGHFWLYQEMCAIEITHPTQSAGEHCDSP